MTPPRWIIPLEPGATAENGARLDVSIIEPRDGSGPEVLVTRYGTAAPGNVVPLWPLGAEATCRLGQALLDASRYIGQEKARREMGGRKR